MNTIGNSCFALGISPKCEKYFRVLYSMNTFFLVENFEKKILKKSMVFG
jgi:hypothetical protein